MSRLRRAGAGGGGVPAPRRVAVAEHELVGALVEEAVGGGVRVGHRHGQRLLRARLDRLADLGEQRVRVDAEVAQARLLALDRVLLAPLLDLLLGHVLHVVVGGVAVHAHRHRLDQRRAVAVQRALARLARGLEHRLGVVAVDADAGEAVGLRALDRVDRELRAGRRRVGVLVVLEDEDHRQLLHAGPVHGLVEVTARGRAVAEPGDRAAALVAQLERHRHPGRDEHHVGQHRDHPDAAEPEVPEVDVAVAPAGDAALAAHVLAEDAGGRDAADEVRAEVAVEDAQAVLRRHRERRADRDGLLAVAVVEGARDLALAVQVHRALLDAAHEQHVAQEGDAVVERQVLGYGGGVLRPLRPGGAHGHPGLVFPLWFGGPAGSPPVALDLASRPGSPDPPTRRAPIELYRRARASVPVIYAGLRMGERVWTARLRWRLRGATMWPAFLIALVVDTVLLRALPIAGEQAPDVFAAALLGAFFNLLAVAVGAPLLGRFVRRRQPSLPKVIAADRAGTGLIAAVAAALLAIGIVHHPVLEARARDFDVQAAAARTFVLGRAPHRFAANVDRMDTMKQGPGLYRSCVPGPTRRRSFCVFVDTRMHPPAVIGDHDQSPNSVLAGPDNPGRIAR